MTNMVKRVARRVLAGGRRESATVGTALMGVLLLAGAALGSGISRTAVEVSDGLTWLGDDERGEVVQVNPSSGKPQTRLQISGPSATLEIAQEDGRLIVLDRRTGQLTVIDLATLLASGRRQTAPGAVSKVLIADGQVFVVDRAAGSVHNADPVSLVDIGKPWLAGQPLADAVVDARGVLWVVDHGGNLRALEWSDDDQRFTERSSRPIAGAGPHTVLVPHEQGVTLLGLENGVVVQDGTGQDLTASTAHLSGEVLAAHTSPNGLVPASVPDSGTVVLVVGDKVLRVDAGALGCAHPARPAVFREQVYIPCRGAGKVIVLNRSGQRGSPDVRTAGSGDPELVFDDGHLFINTPGADKGVIVDADGSTRSVTVRSPELPVTNPDREPIPTVPNPPPPRPDPVDPKRPGGGDTPGEPAPTTTTTGAAPTGVAPGRPGVLAVTKKSADASALVATISWSAPPDNGEPITGYAVKATGAFTGGTKSTQVTTRTADLSFPCAGSTFCTTGKLDVSVTAQNQHGAGVAAVTSWTVPAAPPVPTTTTEPPPVATTTTEPPPVPTTTQPPPTTTTEPPPPSLPGAGAVVISSITGTGLVSRRVNLAPPSDWAGHNGACEVVNLTYGTSTPIACSVTAATIEVDIGSNRIVVRAHAATGGGSVDSAARSVAVRDPDECPPGSRTCVPRSVPASGSEPAPMGAGGIGLLATAFLLHLRARREDTPTEENDPR
jgi:sugar lactone lactonase YvrE